MNYVCKNLDELVAMIHTVADNLEKSKGIGGNISERDKALNRAQAVGMHAAANMVAITIFTDEYIVLEYAKEYKAAEEYAAVQIWASIQRHAGDPRWEYYQGREVCT